jgi:hypothetical protein
MGRRVNLVENQLSRLLALSDEASLDRRVEGDRGVGSGYKLAQCACLSASSTGRVDSPNALHLLRTTADYTPRRVVSRRADTTVAKYSPLSFSKDEVHWGYRPSLSTMRARLDAGPASLGDRLASPSPSGSSASMRDGKDAKPDGARNSRSEAC